MTIIVNWGRLQTVQKHLQVLWFMWSQRSLFYVCSQRHAAPEGHSASEFTKTLETDVLPVLRKQNGFKDEIAFVGSNGAEAVSISMWDRKESADAYARDTYPAVLKSLDK